MRDEVVVERFDTLPIRPVPPPDARLVEQRFVKLAGHRGLFDAVLAEVANAGAEASPAKPLKVLADGSERRVSEVSSTDAGDVIVLAAERFGHDDGIPSPRGEQADSFGSAHAA